ncbi:MAG: hypothetical protein GY838_05740, partial [bacterium]|nr:hypothetical protein [bacterium]
MPGSDDLEVRLSSLGNQGLTDFLPLGWTPVAAAELRLEAAGTVLPEGEASAFAADGVRLELPLPDWVEPSDHLIAVRYQLAAGLWLTLADVEQTHASGGEAIARVSLVGPGTVAIVVADSDVATAPPIPEQGGGVGLLGTTLPEAFPELEAELSLDPPVVLATGNATARVVARSVDRTTAWPSGLAVQVYLEEKLILAGGAGQLLEAPFSADLVLYHPRLDPAEQGSNTIGSAGVLEFKVSPSERAAQVLLDVGWES